MRKLVKFILAVLTLWAAWHIGVSYYHFYVFEDAVREMVQLGGSEAEDALAAQAAKLAADSQVPLKAEDISVRKEAGQLVVEASYVDRVEVLPRYRYPFTHRLRVSVRVLAGLPSNRK
jgi:hypothetical protein